MEGPEGMVPAVALAPSEAGDLHVTVDGDVEEGRDSRTEAVAIVEEEGVRGTIKAREEGEAMAAIHSVTLGLRTTAALTTFSATRVAKASRSRRHT